VAGRIGQFLKYFVSILAKRTFDTAIDRLLSFPGTYIGTFGVSACTSFSFYLLIYS